MEDLTEIQKKQNTELVNCTFVRTILMLSVVLYHSILYWGGNWFVGEPVFSSRLLSVLADWMNTFHIYAFTLVSGYLFCFLKVENGKYGKIVPFIKNKVFRLLVPYAFVLFLWVVPFSYVFNGEVNIVNNILLGINPAQLWFLLMLFWVFIIFRLLADFFEKHTLLGAFVVLGFYGVSIIGAMLVPNMLQIWRGFGYLIFFWIGFKIRQIPISIVRGIPSFVWGVAHTGLFVLVELVSGYDSTLTKIGVIPLKLALYVCGAISAFVVLQRIATKVNWYKNKIFLLFSKNSMPIYLFHQQIVYIFVYLLNGVVNPYVNSLVNFVAATGISLLISVVLMRFKTTRFLIGEK